MKLRKRIAALGAATVMAVSMMSIGASATTQETWGVRYIPTAPTSVNVYSTINYFSSNSTIYSFEENCTSKDNEANYQGAVSYVKYAGYLVKNNGELESRSGTFYRFDKNLNYTPVNLTSGITYTYKLGVKHTLYHNNLYSVFNGNVRA